MQGARGFHMVRKRALFLAFLGVLGIAQRASAATVASASVASSPVQIVTGGDKTVCEEVQVKRELRIFKDPSLFLPILNQLYLDPVSGWKELMRENPLLTTVQGTVYLMRLGPPTAFRNYGAIARLYESVDARLRMRPQRDAAAPVLEGKSVGFRGPTPIVSVMLCGDNDAYKNTMGFVIASDLSFVQQEEEGKRGMPPSVYPNPIPRLPDMAKSEAPPRR